MSCSACSSAVERAVMSVEGVSECSVSLLTNSMTVTGGDADAIVSAVKSAGYNASLQGAKKSDTGAGVALDKKLSEETRTVVLRLVFSSVLLLVLMYISMGHLMWDFPLPKRLASNAAAIGLTELLLASLVLLINNKFFVSGFRAVCNRAPNMDTLVALGSGVSYVWSIAVLYRIIFTTTDIPHGMLHSLYFESAAMIVTLITVGKLLESIAKGRTTNALKGLILLAPRTARVLRDGTERVISADEMRVGDIFVVLPGESIPADGEVIEGVSSVDESALTGESMPNEKEIGSAVYTATQNLSGYIKCRAVKVGGETVLSEIIRTVSDASASKAPIAKVADKISGIFVPAVLFIALVTFVLWLSFGSTVGYALERGISVLVISCPCALGLATPVAIMVGSGIAARGGVLFKNATAMETLGNVKTVVLDKTGTLTSGEPTVVSVLPSEASERTLLSVAALLEARSEHPIAAAVNKYCIDMELEQYTAEDFKALSGSGVYALVDGKAAYGGSLAFIKSICEVDSDVDKVYERLCDKGETPVFFSLDGILLGAISVSDTLREESAEAVSELRKMGIYTVMLTGDNERTGNAVGKKTGVDKIIAGVMPEGKADAISALRGRGRVAMVGDGINDAPALTAADVGVAIGCGTDIAIDSADVVLMHSSPSDLVSAVKIGRKTLRTIHENLFWAFIYNVIGIPLAAGLFIPFFGIELQPMFGAAAMSISSFIVVMNALRLNLVSFFAKKKMQEAYIKSETIGDDKMIKKTVRIKGMMCPHCEARVKTVLSEAEGVVSCDVSFKDGTAVIEVSRDLGNGVYTKLITDAGYEVMGID